MKPPAILFDLDGTLIDSIELLLSSMEHAFAQRSRVPSRPEWTEGIGTPLRTQLREWCDSDVEVEALVDRYRQFQELHLESLTVVYPGVTDVISWARASGYRTGIVTSKGRGMTYRSLDHVKLSGQLDVIVTYEDTDRHKPGPEPVLFALDKLGCIPEGSVFVGDSPHDMHSGRAAGVKTAAALWGPFSRAQLENSEPTWWLSRIAELPGKLPPLPTSP